MTRQQARFVLAYMHCGNETESEAICMAMDALSDRMIDKAELFNKLAVINAPMEANDYKAEVYKIINEL
jgi:SOS response regulatory protein OraA/RecX